MKMSEKKLNICPNCSQIVEHTYQKGYCKSCIISTFDSLKNVLNQSHALYKSDSIKIKKDK